MKILIEVKLDTPQARSEGEGKTMLNALHRLHTALERKCGLSVEKFTSVCLRDEDGNTFVTVDVQGTP